MLEVGTSPGNGGKVDVVLYVVNKVTLLVVDSIK
jgi:hypothetical protein